MRVNTYKLINLLFHNSPKEVDDDDDDDNNNNGLESFLDTLPRGKPT